MFKITPPLYEKIKHFAKFPQTGVSLRQMVLFGKKHSIKTRETKTYTLTLGQKPSPATFFKASQFLHGNKMSHKVVNS